MVAGSSQNQLCFRYPNQKRRVKREVSVIALPSANCNTLAGVKEDLEVVTKTDPMARADEDFEEISKDELKVIFDEDVEEISDNDFSNYPRQKPRQVWQTLPNARDIRLLRILSRRDNFEDDDDRLECMLERCNLDQVNGRYCALSYAWGDKGYGEYYIQCNQVTTKIWRNLHTALIHLRRKMRTGRVSQGTLVWVDALCIDQRLPEGMQERQQQILLMKDIFGSAARVLIWLGVHDKASRQIWSSSGELSPDQTWR